MRQCREEFILETVGRLRATRLIVGRCQERFVVIRKIFDVRPQTFGDNDTHHDRAAEDHKREEQGADVLDFPDQHRGEHADCRERRDDEVADLPR